MCKLIAGKFLAILQCRLKYYQITTKLIKEMPTFIIRNVFLEIDILKKLHQTLNRVNNKKERG